MVCDIINAWYHGNETENFIRKVLMRTLSFTYHIIGIFVFLLLGGNPSGNVLTTILNCIVFQIMIRLFYYKHISKDLGEFQRNVATWTFGDDNFTIFSKYINVTMKDAELFFKTYNMEYTAADKSSITDSQRDIFEMTFLKRKFAIVEHEMVAPIEYNVIVEIPRWSEGDKTNMDNQLQRYNAALLEISNYGRNEFNRMRNIFIKQLRILNEIGFYIPINKLFTYEKCYSIKHETDIDVFSSLSQDELDSGIINAYSLHASWMDVSN